MKCPKCDYLGFETGDRCKNCGYDFSLLVTPAVEGPEPDLTFRLVDNPTPDTALWLDRLDQTLSLTEPLTGNGSRATADAVLDLSLAPEAPSRLGAVAPRAAVSSPPAAPPSLRDAREPALSDGNKDYARDRPRDVPRRMARAAEPTWPEPALPLFSRSTEEDEDQPLIKLPASPRPPLAVRRTPDAPRLREVPKTARQAGLEAELAFTDAIAPAATTTRSHVAVTPRGDRGPAIGIEPGTGVRRLAAVVIDYTILLAIDAAVVYFTLRMAALEMGDWALLPPAPLITFLSLIKFAYFCAFTAMGGQTIGKMAVRIRVVTDNDGPLDAGQSVRRTLAGAVSLLTLGLGFLPALFGPAHRALHDRLARTRVVGLSA